MAQDNHQILKNYLKEHASIESNITSFNEFVDQKVQEIAEEVSENVESEDFQIEIGKVEVGKPAITEADGSTSHVMPSEARLRNLTYSAPVRVELTVRKEDQVDSEEVEIGRMPIMVKSKACNTAGMSDEELTKHNEDPADPGGYFIINGNERVMVMAEDLAENQPFIEDDKKGGQFLRVFSSRGTYRIPTIVNEDKEGILRVSFSRLKEIPVVMVLKALGMVKESDMSQYIGKENDTMIVNFYEYVDIENQEDAMMKISEIANLQGTKKEVLDRVKRRIDAYLFPHMGQSKDDRLRKAKSLCKLVKQYLTVKDNPGLKTDKDHYANKRVRLSGDLLANLFRVNLGILVRDIQYSLQKSAKRNKLYSIKTLAKSTLFTHRVESAIATGTWTGERTGVTQNIDNTNYLDTISQLQRVSSMLKDDQENFMARTLHPTHYGRFCPIETPEGTEIGLRKNLAILAKVSTRVNMDEEKFINNLESKGLDREGKEGYDVFFNGFFIGSVSNREEFVQQLRQMRRDGQLPVQMSIEKNTDYDNIQISTEPGRVLRPLIVVENGTPKLTNEHLNQLEEGSLKWNDLVKQGIIEYLDAAEEENALVALYREEVTSEHTHLEVDPVDLFGIVTTLVPYGNHDQSARLNRGSKTQKQALGLYAANYHVRLDTDVSVLEYPQKPIVRSFAYDSLKNYPAGQNMVVAVMTYEGYNIDDALVFNKSSIDRGIGRSFFLRPYSAVETNYAGGLKDEIAVPEKDSSGYRTEESYRFLEEDGIAYPEAEVTEGEILVGKMSPPKFLSEAKEISVKTKKESSEPMRLGEEGVVDDAFVTEDSEGNKTVQVRTRDQRIPELGDKFANTHGQKGVIGRVVPEDDLPFSATGIKPDVLFNPHGIPSRMTIGYLMELLGGKVGSVKGDSVDGTPFTGESKEELEDQLQNLGFRFDGKETMYDGITGKRMVSKIFVGNMYYLKLKYMAANKLHGRASGKVALLTRQPIEGRARGGALRLGEMEQQALVAHGSSLLLKERYDSDKIKLPVCTKCGSIGIEDEIRSKLRCPVCNSEEVEFVEVSYAFKLLLEELQGLHLHTTLNLKNKYEG